MDLHDYRRQIDQIDKELLDAFLRRMQVAGEIADYKMEHDLPILNKQRERDILAAVEEQSGDMELYAHRFFANLMELSRSYQASRIQKPTRLIQTIEDSCLTADAVFPKHGNIAISGVEGAYAQIAADRLFPRGSLQFLPNFESVFDAVEHEEVDYGILPIENSSFGSVKGVYNLLQEREVYITRSTRVNVQHELLARPGVRLSGITTVYSHEQAIGQCSKFLKELGDTVRVIPVANTAMAAKMVSESDEPGAAAIASHDAGQLYGLKTVRSNIMDTANNYTRFVVIRKKPLVYPGANRVSVILATEHRPGALYDVLSMITALDLNMVKLESAPMVGTDFEFVFYIDLETSVWEHGTLELLAALERTCPFFKYLGNYPEV